MVVMTTGDGVTFSNILSPSPSSFPTQLRYLYFTLGNGTSPVVITLACETEMFSKTVTIGGSLIFESLGIPHARLIVGTKDAEPLSLSAILPTTVLPDFYNTVTMYDTQVVLSSYSDGEFEVPEIPADFAILKSNDRDDGILNGKDETRPVKKGLSFAAKLGLTGDSRLAQLGEAAGEKVGVAMCLDGRLFAYLSSFPASTDC